MALCRSFHRRVRKSGCRSNFIFTHSHGSQSSRAAPNPLGGDRDDLGDRRETGDDQGPQTIKTLSLIFSELAIQRPLLTTSAIGMPPIRQTSLAAFGLCSEPSSDE